MMTSTELLENLFEARDAARRIANQIDLNLTDEQFDTMETEDFCQLKDFFHMYKSMKEQENILFELANAIDKVSVHLQTEKVDRYISKN